jgi:hypothetical protein
MLQRVLDAVVSTIGTLAWILGLVLLVGVVAHGLAWLLVRRRAARWVWSYWNGVGTTLTLAGLAGIGYAWIVLGFQTPAGSALAGLGLLLLSAGLWMLIPV